MSTLNTSTEQVKNKPEDSSPFNKFVVLFKQCLPKHVDAIIASDAYLAMNKLQKHVLIEWLSKDKSYHKSEGNKFSISLELEEKTVKIDRECNSNSHLKPELDEIDILDIPQDIRELTKKLAVDYNLDFFVSLFTPYSEWIFKNEFPVQIDTYKKDSHGYSGDLSIWFQEKIKKSNEIISETSN